MPQLTVEQAFHQALQHHQAGRVAEAEQIYRQILVRHPNHVDSLQNLGIILHRSGHYDAAIELTRRAVALKPDSAEALSNLANALKDSGQLEEAIDLCRRAIALKPDLGQAHNNLGLALIGKGQFTEAIAACRRAVQLMPNSANPLNNLGVALAGSGQLEEALLPLRKAIALDPNFPQAHTNAANILRDQGLLDEAIAGYQCALALRPDSAESHNNLANALTDLGRVDEAVDFHRRAIQLKPDYAQAHGNLLLSLLYRYADDGPAIFAEHRAWSDAHIRPVQIKPAEHANDSSPDRQLRIGYISPDLRRHPVGYFLLPVLAHHDRAKFEIHCYSNSRRSDSHTECLKRHCDAWHDIVNLIDDQAAALIRSDAIDILVDLAGHTAGGRLSLFARKPAPVQITYLGYPATTGLSQIDYRFTDSIADPPGQTDFVHSEKLLRLPICNWCFARPEDSPPIGPSPAASGRPIHFASFNNFAKVSPPIMKLWAAILAKTPGSCLVIKSRGLDQASAQARIRQSFTEAGISSDRLLIRGHEPKLASHFDAYNQVDIALDTFPYHGTMTTCESLWMGVPVVTLAGSTHAARVGVSLLTAVGLPELIAKSFDQYVSIAAGLANDVSRLAAMRQTLRRQIADSPLMDAPRFTRDIETAYRQIWRAWSSGRKPAQL